MGHFLQIPTAYMTSGACGYVYDSLLLYDTVSQTNFWLQVCHFDTRGTPDDEYTAWDEGTNSAFFTSYFGSDTQYVTKSPYSYSSTGTTWSDWHFYRFHVSHSQISQIAAKINSEQGTSLSTNPSNYRLDLLTVQNEIYCPVGTNGHLGMSAYDIYLYEEYGVGSGPVVPEPATIAMSAFALMGLAGIAKKKINSRRS